MTDRLFQASTIRCPCDSALKYKDCCAQWHHGEQRLQAPDAKTLMRSRYSAFVLDELNYLLETWHPSTRPTELEPNPYGIKWLGLSIRAHDLASPTEAYVEFVARSRLAGRASRLHERSRFLYEEKRWFYVDGLFLNR